MSIKPNASNLVAATVTKIEYKPETAPKGKADTKQPERHVDQSFVDAFLNAENGVKESAVALFSACCEFRVSPAQFVGRSDAKVRASEFNNARTAAMLLGVKNARAEILKAAAKPGDKRANVLASLRSFKSVAPELKSSALKGAALSKEIVKRADAASTAASAAFKAKADEAKATRIPRVAAPKANSVAAFAPLLLAALADSMKKMDKVSATARELPKWKELVAAMSEAVDICESLVKA